jgi:twinkle protein
LNEFIETHIPCPCGSSSDAYSKNANGSGFCFSCSKFFKGDSTIGTNLKEYTDIEGEFKIMSHRGISERTMDFYNVQTKLINGEPREVGFRYPNGAHKIRLLTEKKFWNTGPMKEAGLFGKNLFDPGSKRSITLTEGEFDALAVYEMTRGDTAACSIKSASSAKRDCTTDWEYINSFDKIILAFDSDEPGQNAMREVATLFDFNKLYQVRFHKYKDANDYLQHGEMNEFVSSWKNARRFAPDNIISTFADISKTLEESKEDQIGTYPIHRLNASLYGLHQGEVVLFKGLEGIGKTEIFRAMEHHLLASTTHNIGIIHLEEDNGTTVKAIAGYEIGLPAVLPDCGLSKEDIFEGYKKAVGGDEGRVHLYSSFDVEDENTLLANIRFLVSAAGCRFIFLDHISWLATGLQDEDERKKLDRISQKLKLLAKELKFCLVMISHVNDEGKTRGSRNISKVANTVIHLDRNTTDNDPNERNKIFLTIEKARLGGRTGPAGVVQYNSITGRLEDFDTNGPIMA